LEFVAPQILAPLLLSGQPLLLSDSIPGSQALDAWFATIAALRDAIWGWMTKHDKHYKVRHGLRCCFGLPD
jgi:hypothetical protein